MLETDGSEFVPVVKKKVADRPHWITILLGVVAPILALVALYMSVLSFRISQGGLRTSGDALTTSQQSLEMSRISMKVLQRAYIGVRRHNEEPRADGVFHIPLTITNLGNTPASHIKLTYFREGANPKDTTLKDADKLGSKESVEGEIDYFRIGAAKVFVDAEFYDALDTKHLATFCWEYDSAHKWAGYCTPHKEY